MKPEEIRLLQALRAALRGASVDWGTEVTAEELTAVLQLAMHHRVLPLVYHAVRRSPAGQSGAEILGQCRRNTMQSAMLQTRKDAAFLPLMGALKVAGVQALVVKGMVVRNLYPSPELRASNDEDLLIPQRQYDACREVLERFGLETEDPGADDYEIPYRGKNSPMYLEVHKSLFPPENRAYGHFNRFFAEAWDRSILVQGVPTLCHTDHMLYLILHALKHFIHSGFGIRQVCDIVLFAEKWGSEIRWDYVLDCCRQVRAERFAAGIFAIGSKHLGFSGMPEMFPEVDEMPMLADLMQAGIFGNADPNRQHSSTITLGAAESGGGSGNLMKTLFPSADYLQGSYPYLKTKPWLLPAAWAQRLVRYGTAGGHRNRAGESVRVGRERVALLKRYGIIEE